MLATRLTAWLRPALTLAATAATLALTACGGGSGAPNNPYEPLPPTPGPLVVVPAEAVAYAGTPLILSITGGVPPYQAFSANPAVLPVPTNVTGNTLTLMANNVDTAQSANVTIRDAAGALAGSEIVVRPSLLLPASITIVANGAPCPGGDVCSGQTGSATVRVTGSGGVPLPGRQVRFDVVQGQYAIQTTNPGSPLAPTQTVVSDANGEARVIISVPANTPTQIALLRATEAPNVCSAGVRVSYYVFGGTPPYRVVTNFPDAVALVGTPVPVNGGGFDVITNGTCFTGLTFAVTDATGRTLTTGLPIVENVPGTGTPPTQPVALQVIASGTGSAAAPVACAGTTFPITIIGKPPFSATSSRAGVLFGTNPVTVSPGQLNVSGVPAGGATTITIGDANTPQQIATVTIYCQ